MSIVEIQQSMERNRWAFDQHVAQIRQDASISVRQRRRLLAECWFDAMRIHYQLLSDYLQLRHLINVSTGWAPQRLATAQLRAPRRPAEIPESLSRYVTAAHHSEHLI